MYDELVRCLREHAKPWNCADNCICKDATQRKYGSCSEELAKLAADAIEELSREYESIAKSLTESVELVRKLQQPRWVPVTEAPPLKVGDDGYNGYLVYANGYYEVADYTTDKFDNVPYFHVNGEYEPDVTHFMPLPEPPKEEA